MAGTSASAAAKGGAERVRGVGMMWFGWMVGVGIVGMEMRLW